MKNETLLGIDEFTLVLSFDKSEIDLYEISTIPKESSFPTFGELVADVHSDYESAKNDKMTDIHVSHNWSFYAEKVIKEFVKLTQLENIFGRQMSLETSCPQGYKIGYEFGKQPFYFAIAYHPDHIQMGVIVKFSAYSWAQYCSNWLSTNQNTMNLKEFFNLIESDLYTFRLSRVDFTADYQNWDFTVDQMYRKITNNEWIIQNSSGKKNCSQLSAYERNSIVNTFYLGSKKSNTRMFMRVYDKREEQLSTFGFRYNEALTMVSWIRFEIVFKGTYAHQLTKMIVSEVKTENDLKTLISNKFVEKYSFYDRNNEPLDFTNILLNSSEDKFSRLRLESPRNNTLNASINYLANGSGLFSTMYKCKKIWGKDTELLLMMKLLEHFKLIYQPNEDTLLWLKNNKTLLEKQNFLDIFNGISTNINTEEKETVIAPTTAKNDNLDVNVDE